MLWIYKVVGFEENEIKRFDNQHECFLFLSDNKKERFINLKVF